MNFTSALHSLLFVVLWMLAFLVPLAIAELLARTQQFQARLILLAGVALVLLLGLSGCGTAPLVVQTRPPVPAELLTRPRPPVMLKPTASASATPGATTSSTPASAPKTGSTTRP